MEQILLLEALLRGATAGILLVSAALFVRGAKSHNVEVLGAAFFIATAAYTLISSPDFFELLGPLQLPFAFLATLNSVLFWWFATALFDDEFRWEGWRFIPLGLILGLFVLRTLTSQLIPGTQDSNLIQQVVVIAMVLHVLWLALAHRHDDLVERRRAFRLVFSVLAGVFGLIIAIGEITIGDGRPPSTLMLWHAATLFALTLGLAVWILPPITFLERSTPLAPATSPNVTPEEEADLKILKSYMGEGGYRQEQLTIGALARELNLPEHKLRRLINGALGYRNFTAFLNEYRLAEARIVLSDPQQARKQITEIALDLGYGSVGPFNRAFKAATGTTPSEFRKSARSSGPSDTT